MSTELQTKPPEDTPPEDTTGFEPTANDLADLRREIDRQGKGIRNTQQAFMIFAVLALLVSFATLMAVVFKLDKKTTTPTVTAAQTATPAQTLPNSTRAVLKEFSITPAPARVAAGKVSFAVANGGRVKHEFVVLRTNKPAGSLLKGSEADETGNVGEIADLQPGQTKHLSLNLKAGHYALICNLPGHYSSGQHADFTVVNVK